MVLVSYTKKPSTFFFIWISKYGYLYYMEKPGGRMKQNIYAHQLEEKNGVAYGEFNLNYLVLPQQYIQKLKGDHKYRQWEKVIGDVSYSYNFWVFEIYIF